MAPESEAPATATNGKTKTRKPLFIFLAVVISAAAVAGTWLFLTRGDESTDDAQVESDVVPLGPRMMAGVVAVVVVMLALLAVPFLVGVTALAMAAMNHAASRAFLGQAINIRESYSAIWKRGWRYFGLFVFEVVLTWVIPMAVWFGLTVFSAVLLPLAVAAGVDPSGGGLLLLLGFLVVCGLIAYGCWISIRMSLAFPATVVEQIGVWDGLKRSSALTNGSKGRIFLLYLLGTALNWILSFAFTVPVLIIVSLVPAANGPQHADTVGTIVLLVIYGGSFAVQAFTRPVYGIALMLFYYDQRIRQEAFDIEWMMLKAGLVVPATLPEAQGSMAGVSEMSSVEVEPIGMTEALAETDVPESSTSTQRIHENIDDE